MDCLQHLFIHAVTLQGIENEALNAGDGWRLWSSPNVHNSTSCHR